MIIGIGTDVIQIPRIEKILNRHSSLFIKKYFSHSELEKYKNYSLTQQQLASKLAKLFSAKEAFVKALGTGVRLGISLKEIEVLSDKMGKPYFNITGITKDYIKNNMNYKNIKYHLSLSDDYPIGTAFVIIEELNQND